MDFSYENFFWVRDNQCRREKSPADAVTHDKHAFFCMLFLGNQHVSLICQAKPLMDSETRGTLGMTLGMRTLWRLSIGFSYSRTLSFGRLAFASGDCKDAEVIMSSDSDD